MAKAKRKVLNPSHDQPDKKKQKSEAIVSQKSAVSPLDSDNNTKVAPAENIGNDEKTSRPDQGLLDSFYGLPDTNKFKRIASVKGIVAKLQKNPKAQSSNYSYCLSRLIKGMDSSRLASRLGNATALTELLVAYPTFNFSEVLAAVNRELPVENEGKPEEISMGRIVAHSLCLLAIWKSKRCSVEELRQLSGKFLDLKQKYSQLSMFLTKCIINCAILTSADNFNAVFGKRLQKECNISSLENVSADQLWMALELSKQFPEAISLPLKLLNIQGDQIEFLAKILQASCRVSAVHPVWNLVLEEISRGKGSSIKLWPELITTYFLENGKQEIVLLGMKLTETALGTGDIDSKQLGKQSHKPGDGVLPELVDRALKTSPRFDQLTRTKMVEIFVSNFSLGDAEKYLKQVDETLKTGDVTVSIAHVRHLSVLFHSTGSGNQADNDSILGIRSEALRILSSFLYPKTVECDDQLQRACYTAIKSCLQRELN